jgi:hypothetical protein
MKSLKKILKKYKNFANVFDKININKGYGYVDTP